MTENTRGVSSCILRAALVTTASLAALPMCGGSSDVTELAKDGSAGSGGDTGADSGDVTTDSPDTATDVDATAACIPGVTKPCYPGPPGTEGIGACKAGLAVCPPDGSGFGDCIAAVVPASEVCATPYDDDCDGKVNEEGPDCVCTPGTEVACYSGPPDTVNVGDCGMGKQACLETGAGFGPCLGQTTPKQEDCNVTGDEDCDGAADCPGDVAWQFAWGVNQKLTVSSAARGAGNRLGVLFHAPAYPSYWFEFDEKGVVGFSKEIGPDVYPAAIAGHPTGSARLVLGGYAETPNFDSWLLPKGSVDPFVAGYTTGTYASWAKGFPSTTGTGIVPFHISAQEVDLDPGWYLTGIFQTELAMGSVKLLGGQYPGEPFVAKLDDAGEVMFAKKFAVSGGSSISSPSVQAMKTSGAVAAGVFSGTINIVGSDISSAGGTDVLIARFDSQGNATSAKGLGGTGDEDALLAQHAGAGTVVLAGTTTAGFSLGVTNLAPGMFLARFTDQLQPMWTLSVPDCTPNAVALDDATDGAAVAATCSNTVNLGGGPIGPGNLVAVFDSSGKLVWQRTIPIDADVKQLVALNGGLHLVGEFEKPIDFGAGSMAPPACCQSSGAFRAIFVVRLTK